jgi:hypothetical protein
MRPARVRARAGGEGQPGGRRGDGRLAIGASTSDLVREAADRCAQAAIRRREDARRWAAASAAWAAAWVALYLGGDDSMQMSGVQAAHHAAEAAAMAAGPERVEATLATCADLVRARIPCPTLPA